MTGKSFMEGNCKVSFGHDEIEFPLKHINVKYATQQEVELSSELEIKVSIQSYIGTGIDTDIDTDICEKSMCVWESLQSG